MDLGCVFDTDNVLLTVLGCEACLIVIVEEAVETIWERMLLEWAFCQEIEEGKLVTYPAPYTKMPEDSTIRRPQDLRHEAVVQVEKVGSENALDGVNGVKASGLDWKYLQVQLEQ